MSQDEESSGRVTRGALRRRSIDQDTSIGPGTPKKTAAASAKKGPALDAILETNGTSESPALKGVNKAVQKLKELEPEKVPAGRRSRATSLTEDNVETAAGGSSEVRRTPRRRASQDVSVTPQTAPAATRRMTRRNSVASDDGSSVSTPKAATAKSRLNVSVAPPTIVEDDEKETSTTAEADLSDLDIRKLRNRSISNSPVPRGSPTGKNSSIKEEESNTSLSSSSTTKPVNVLLQDIVRSPKPPTPKPEELSAETSVVEMEPLVVTASNAKLNESVEKTPNKEANTSQQQQQQQPRKSVSGSAQKLQKSVTFDEAATPERQNQSAYPRTPVPQSAEKSFKFGEKMEEEKKEDEVGKEAETVKSPPEVFEIDETVHESPKDAPEQTPTQPESTTAAATTTPKTPQKDTVATPDQQSTEEENPLDKSSAKLDQSLANIVEDVRENLAAGAAADLSMSILGTPAKPKAHLLPRLREGSCSTPIGESKKLVVGSPKFVSNTPDGRGQKGGEDGKSEGEKLSKSWSQAVKGSAGKGIDVFSVRKQEEQERKDEEAKKLNESLKEASLKKGKKSPKKKKVEEDEEEDDEDEVGVSELLGGESSQESNFLDDEAMEVDGDYESGDSMDSEERREMEENEIPEHGETIGSEDSDNEGSDEDEEGDDDSFIAPEDEEDDELLDGTGDDLSSESEQDKSKTKKRKRIIQVEESSDDEKEVSKKNLSTVSLDHTTTASENSTVEVAKSPKKTPAKDVEKSPKKTPSKTVEQSPKKSPIKQPTPAKEPVTKSPAKQNPTETSEPPKSRKSLPAASLISADFYSPAAKKAKRATINVLANGGTDDDSTAEKEPPAKPTPKKQQEGLLANPAALALAKKNKRQSLDQVSAAPAKPESKRSSLPMKLPEDKPLDKSLVKQKAKKQQDVVVVEEEPMEVDEDQENSDGGDEVEQVVPQKEKKKKVVAKDLSEFDTDAILARCNEVLRTDKERKKQSATAKQKKKDEKRRQREQAEGEGDEDDEEKEQTGGADSAGSPDKKKKKKKKPINYLLEELGETREEQVARALKRKLALLEAKRERKKAKKAAKLQRQLNKENQEGESAGVGIGAKFEKKAKKKDKKGVVEQLVTEPVVEVPKVKLAVSAFQAYKEQIEELQKDQGKGKKKKQLKEKNQLQQQQQPPTAVEEVKAALQVEPAKAKKEKKKVPEVVVEEVVPVEAEKPKKKKKHDEPEVFEFKPKKPTKTPAEIMAASLAEQKKLDEELAQIKRCITEPIPKIVKKPKTAAEQRKLDEDLAKLKQALSDPSNKIVKKQKLIHQEKPTVVTCPEVESTPPRKLIALARLESGFTEEAVTPEAQKIKRNHGFREEPVTPKPVGFKVSAVLPTGQQELAQRAALTKKHHKKSANANRIRPEDVQEPKRSLPLPVWTRSGTFDVEELTTASGDKKKPKKSKSFDDGYIPVNGTGGKTSTEFLVKPLSSKKETSKKANRIDLATVDDEVINFKKQAIFGKTAHLREKKSKH